MVGVDLVSWLVMAARIGSLAVHSKRIGFVTKRRSNSDLLNKWSFWIRFVWDVRYERFKCVVGSARRQRICSTCFSNFYTESLGTGFESC